MTKARLEVVLASPRGFCAGVDRAIQIVLTALARYGAPIYVRHEIVHNRYVVESLAEKGAIFVKELDEVPDGARVVFSAHGVAKSVPALAGRRHMIQLDATCPLVSKVHREAERHHARGRRIILIGHAGHPEVDGTMGQLPEDSIALVETIEEARRIVVTDPENLAFVTQTTLSIDDTREIVDVLRARFPRIAGPKQEDICYATTNRQLAVKAIARSCDMIVVMGAANSSNSNRLVEVALREGVPDAVLLDRAADMDWSRLVGCARLGLTAGASAPEVVVEEMIAACRARFDVTIEEIKVVDEDIHFKLPRALVA